MPEVVSRRQVISLLNGLLLFEPLRQVVSKAKRNKDTARERWVAETLTEMLRIVPGMTRADLLKVFDTEGGLSTALQETFVSQACMYLKVDVTFRPIGRPLTDEQGGTPLIFDPRDVIVTISRPYLGYAVFD